MTSGNIRTLFLSARPCSSEGPSIRRKNLTLPLGRVPVLVVFAVSVGLNGGQGFKVLPQMVRPAVQLVVDL